MELDRTGYFAGFFDGEGNIYKSLKTGRVQLRVAQNMVEPLDLFSERFGGHVYKDRVGKQLVITRTADVIACLEALLPYLIVKHKKASEILAYMRALNVRVYKRRIEKP